MKIFASCVLAVLALSVWSMDPELLKIRDRNNARAIQSVNDSQVSRELKQQRGDGSWPGIDYRHQGRGAWSPRKHLSRLRLLLAYKELRRAHAGQHQCEQILQTINKGRSVKYVLYHLQKVASYWKIEELESCICQIFTLQLHIRRGTASPADMGPLICLYCR